MGKQVTMVTEEIQHYAKLNKQEERVTNNWILNSVDAFIKDNYPEEYSKNRKIDILLTIDMLDE